MKHTDSHNTRRPRAFTLIELLVSILIIGVLIGLLVVGMRQAFAAARKAATTQDVSALKVAVQTFKNDFGFLPPLVKDGYTGSPDQRGPLVVSDSWRTVPNVYSISDPIDLRYLRGESNNPRYRYSVYSLAYYIMGELDKEIDGLEGPGARKPKRNGSFDRLTNETYEALFDPKTGGVVFAAWLPGDVPSTGRFELQDRNGVAYRYYRWQPGTMAAGDDERGVLNVPELVEVARERTELGDAAFAIVAAGADGVFGDIGDQSETLAQIEDALGKRFTGSTAEAEAKAEAAARVDNIVEVGR